MLQNYKINKLKLNKTPTPPYPTSNGVIQFINALSKKIQVSINLKWIHAIYQFEVDICKIHAIYQFEVDTYARFMPFINLKWIHMHDSCHLSVWSGYICTIHAIYRMNTEKEIVVLLYKKDVISLNFLLFCCIACMCKLFLLRVVLKIVNFRTDFAINQSLKNILVNNGYASGQNDWRRKTLLIRKFFYYLPDTKNC